MNRFLKVLAAVCLVLVSIAALLFIRQSIGTKTPLDRGAKSSPSGTETTQPAPKEGGQPPAYAQWFTVPGGRFFLGSTRADVLAAQGSPSSQVGAPRVLGWEGGRVYFDSTGRVSQFVDYRGVTQVNGQQVSGSPLRLGVDPVGATKETIAIGSTMATVLGMYGSPLRAEATTQGVFFEYQSGDGKSGWLRFTLAGHVDIIDSNGFFNDFYGHRDTSHPEASGE